MDEGFYNLDEAINPETEANKKKKDKEDKRLTDQESDGEGAQDLFDKMV